MTHRHALTHHAPCLRALVPLAQQVGVAVRDALIVSIPYLALGTALYLMLVSALRWNFGM